MVIAHFLEAEDAMHRTVLLAPQRHHITDGFFELGAGTLMRLRAFSGEASWVALDQAGTALASFAGVKILTGVLDPSTFGVYALALTIINMIHLNLFVPFGQTIIRFWGIYRARGAEAEFDGLLRAIDRGCIRAFCVLSALVGAAVSLCCSVSLGCVVMLSFLIGLLNGLFGLKQSVCLAERQRKKFALFNILINTMRPLGAIAAVMLYAPRQNAAVALLGMLAGGAGAYTIIHATFTLKTRAREAAFELPRERYREILAYASPFIVWGLSGWIYLSVDRWCAGLVLGVEGVGLLAVVSQVAMYPLAFGSGFLSSLFMPIAFQKAGALTDRAAIGKAISIPLISACAFAAGAAILAAIFGVWHREVIILLSRTRYTALSSLLPVMTLAWAMFFLAQAITQCGQVLNNTKAFMVPKSASTLLMGLCTYGMARVYGAEGIAWGMLTGGAVYVLWTGGVVWQLLRRERVWQMALH